MPEGHVTDSIESSIHTLAANEANRDLALLLNPENVGNEIQVLSHIESHWALNDDPRDGFSTVSFLAFSGCKVLRNLTYLFLPNRPLITATEHHDTRPLRQISKTNFQKML